MYHSLLLIEPHSVAAAATAACGGLGCYMCASGEASEVKRRKLFPPEGCTHPDLISYTKC